jgi:hypothetical protein
VPSVAERVKFGRRGYDRWHLAAYTLLIAVIVFGFWRIERGAERIEHESRARAYVLCVGLNEVRLGSIEFIAELAMRDGEISEGEQAAIDAAYVYFEPRQCPPDPDGVDGAP